LFDDPAGLWEELDDRWTTSDPNEITDLVNALRNVGVQDFSVQRGDGLDEEAFRLLPTDNNGVHILYNRSGEASESNRRNFPAGPFSEQNIFGYPNPNLSPAVESVDDPFTFALGGAAKTAVKGAASLVVRAVSNAAPEGVALAKTGIVISEHAALRMTEREITKKMVEVGISKGTKYFDPKNGTFNYVLKSAFASGDDLLISTNTLTGRIVTVIKNKNLINSRLIPQ
jgi:hypothetical protein